MILQCLRRHAEERPDDPFLADGSEALSFRETDERARRMGGALSAKYGVTLGSAVYIYASDSARLVTALLATQYAGAKVCVLNRSFGEQDLARVASRLEPGPLITDSESVPGWTHGVISLDELAAADGVPHSDLPSAEGGIVVLTTGTTGASKAVFHVWDRLFAQTRMEFSGAVRRWALLYPLNHFAGLQVFLHAIRNGLFLGIPASRKVGDVADCLTRHEIDSVSATPTFWRMFAGQLDAADSHRFRLAQITLGGEPVTADILDRLRSLFPAARVTHVYATTETGSCFAVSDGLPGFPARYLSAPVGSVRLAIREGQLYVQTASAMVGYVDGSAPPEQDGDWIATGDSVEIRDDRVYFMGRKSEVINVGGVKVFPPVVEEQIRRISGVRDVRVYGKANPVTGQLVAADIEVSGTVANDVVLAEVKKVCRERLSRYEQPRELRIVEELTRSNEKLVRK